LDLVELGMELVEFIVKVGICHHDYALLRSIWSCLSERVGTTDNAENTDLLQNALAVGFNLLDA
jgi:hypothetical protein